MIEGTCGQVLLKHTDGTLEWLNPSNPIVVEAQIEVLKKKIERLELKEEVCSGLRKILKSVMK